MARTPATVDTAEVSAAQQPPVALSVAEAAARVGLTAATLRTWDRRYGLSPSARTAGGHRRYTASDLQRLGRAAGLIAAGHPAAEAVAASAGTVPEPRPQPNNSGGGRVLPLPGGDDTQRGIARAAMAVDTHLVTSTLTQLIEQHGVVQVWDEVIGPVLIAVGERWSKTGSGVEVEHTLATGVTAALLATTPPPVASTRPVLLACMPDEEHVLPLLALNSALLATGTPTVLIGHKVPARALADAIQRVRPRRVVLWAQTRQRADPDILHVVPAMRPKPDVVLLGPGWSATATAPTDADTVEAPKSLAEAVDRLAVHA